MAKNSMLEDFDISSLSFRDENGNITSWSDYGDSMSHINHSFIINDLEFIVPPEKISSTEENNYIQAQSLRSRSSDKLPVGIANEIFTVSFTLPGKNSIVNLDSRDDQALGNNTGKRGGILDFILQFKNVPFSVIENATLRTKLKIPPYHNMVFCMHNLALTTSPGEPDTILGSLTFTPMSYACYSDFWHYKKNWISKTVQSFEDVNEIHLPLRNRYLDDVSILNFINTVPEGYFNNINDKFAAGINRDLLANTLSAGVRNQYIVDPDYQTVESLHKLDNQFMLPYQRTQFARESEPYKAYMDWLFYRHTRKRVSLTESFDCTKISPYGSADQNLGNRLYLRWKEFRSIQIDPIVAEKIRNDIKLTLKNFQLRLFKGTEAESYLTKEEAELLAKSKDGNTPGFTPNRALTGDGKIDFFGGEIPPLNTSAFGAIRQIGPNDNQTRIEFTGEQFAGIKLVKGQARNIKANGELADGNYYFHKGLDISPSYPAGVAINDTVVKLYTPFDIRIEENTVMTEYAQDNTIQSHLPVIHEIRDKKKFQTSVIDETTTLDLDGVTYKAQVNRFGTDFLKSNSNAVGLRVEGRILNGPFKDMEIRFWHVASITYTATGQRDGYTSKEEFKKIQEIYKSQFGPGKVIRAGEWIGAYMGGTAVQDNSPHLHVEVCWRPTGAPKHSMWTRIDIGPLILNSRNPPPVEFFNKYYELFYDEISTQNSWQGLNIKKEDLTYDRVNKAPELKRGTGGDEGVIRAAIKYALDNGANSSWRKQEDPYTGKKFSSLDQYLSSPGIQKRILAERSTYHWEYYALQIKLLEDAGYYLYEGDLTNFDLFYKEHVLEVVTGNDAMSREMKYPLICDFISATSSNNFKMLNIQGIMAPTAQFLGSQDDSFLLSLKGFGLNSIKQLEIVRDTLRKQGVMYKHIQDSYCLRVENNFINAFGNVYFVINGIEMAAVPEQPGVYACEMRLTSNDVLIKQQRLKKESTVESRIVKESFISEFLGSGGAFDGAGLFPPGVARDKDQIAAYEKRFDEVEAYQLDRYKRGIPMVGLRDVDVLGEKITGVLGLFVPGDKMAEAYLSSSRYLLEILAHINLVNSLLPRHTYADTPSADIYSENPEDPDGYAEVESLYSYLFTEENFVGYIPEKRITNLFSPWIRPTKPRTEPYTADHMYYWNPDAPEFEGENLRPQQSAEYRNFVAKSNFWLMGTAPVAWDWFLEKPDYEGNYDFSDNIIRPFAITGPQGAMGYQKAKSLWLESLNLESKRVASNIPIDGKDVPSTFVIPGAFFPYIRAHRNVMAIANNTRQIDKFYNALVAFEGSSQLEEIGHDMWDFFTSDAAVAVYTWLAKEIAINIALTAMIPFTLGASEAVMIARLGKKIKDAEQLAKAVTRANELAKAVKYSRKVNVIRYGGAGDKVRMSETAADALRVRAYWTNAQPAAYLAEKARKAEAIRKAAREAGGKMGFFGQIRNFWKLKSHRELLLAEASGRRAIGIKAIKTGGNIATTAPFLWSYWKHLSEREKDNNSGDQHNVASGYIYIFNNENKGIPPWGGNILDGRANGQMLNQSRKKTTYETEVDIGAGVEAEREGDVDWVSHATQVIDPATWAMINQDDASDTKFWRPDDKNEETKISLSSILKQLGGTVEAINQDYNAGFASQIFERLGLEPGSASLVGQDFYDYLWEFLCIPYLNNVLRYSDIQKVVRYTPWFPETKKLLGKVEADLVSPAYEDMELPFHPYWNTMSKSGISNYQRGSSFTDADFYLSNPGVDYRQSEQSAPDMSDYVVVVESTNGEKTKGDEVSETDKRRFVPGVSMNEFRNLLIDVQFEKALEEMQGMGNIETNIRRSFTKTGSAITGSSTSVAHNTNITAQSKTEQDEVDFASQQRGSLSDYIGRVNAASSNRMKEKKIDPVPSAANADPKTNPDVAVSPNVVSWQHLSMMLGENVDLLSPLAGGTDWHGNLFSNPLLNFTYQQYDSLGTEFYLNTMRSNFNIRSFSEAPKNIGNFGTPLAVLPDGKPASGDPKKDKRDPSVTNQAAREFAANVDGQPLLFDFFEESSATVPGGSSGSYMETGQFRTPLKVKVANALKSINRPKLAARRAFPVVKVYFFEEDDIFSKQWMAFDEIYSYSRVESLNISDSRKRPAAICTITFSDVNGILSGFNQWNKASTGQNNGGYEESLFGTENKNPFTDDTSFEQNEFNFNLTPGLKIKVCIGFSNDPNKLEEVFLGEITDVQMEGMSSRMTVVAQSYGAELVAQIKGAKTEWGKDSIPVSYRSTFATLSNLMFSEEVVHFGRRRLDDVVMFGEDQSLEKEAVQFKETVNQGALYNSGRRRGWAGWWGELFDSTGGDSAGTGFLQGGAMTAAAKQKAISALEGPQDDNLYPPNANASQLLMWTDSLGRWTNMMGGKFTVTEDEAYFKQETLMDNEYIPGTVFLEGEEYWTRQQRAAEAAALEADKTDAQREAEAEAKEAAEERAAAARRQGD
jgi:hypothetical protein